MLITTDVSTPPDPSPTTQDLNIPVEAYAARTAARWLESGQALDPILVREAERANATRAQELENEYVARQREILSTGPDAFLAKRGRDALLGADDTIAELEAARRATLSRAANPVQHALLKQSLDRYGIAAHYDIGTHVGRQSLAWQKDVASARLANLIAQAGLDYADPSRVEAHAEASEPAALDRAWASGFDRGSDEAKEQANAARSAVVRSAIESALKASDNNAAIKLYERAGTALVQADALMLGRQVNDARELQTAQDYLATLPSVDSPTKLDARETAYDALRRNFTSVATSDLPIRGAAIPVAYGNGEVLSDAPPEPLREGQRYAQGGNGGPRSSGPRRAGPPTTPMEEMRSANFQSHLNALRKLEPNNRQLSYIAPPGWIPKEEDVARVHEELLNARQRQAERSLSLQDRIGVGKYAGESIPARSGRRDFTEKERAEINRIGAQTGCHTCGSRDPRTPSGNFILDHQPPTRLIEQGTLQRLYPQCLSCSARQGGLISQEVQRKN
jgi:hypothetical protein